MVIKAAGGAALRILPWEPELVPWEVGEGKLDSSHGHTLPPPAFERVIPLL